MPEIMVVLDDDVAGTKTYEAQYKMTSPPVAAHYGSLAHPGWPAEGAEFEVVEILDVHGRIVHGGEFDAVWNCAMENYYEEMLETAMERPEL